MAIVVQHGTQILALPDSVHEQLRLLKEKMASAACNQPGGWSEKLVQAMVDSHVERAVQQGQALEPGADCLERITAPRQGFGRSGHKTLGEALKRYSARGQGGETLAARLAQVARCRYQRQIRGNVAGARGQAS